MSTLNKCLFIGNLTRNVILAKTGSDLSVCNFTLAISSLRKKLGVYANGTERIKSIRSVGYLYAVQPN